MGLQRPNYTSPLSEYVLQIELLRGWEVPKLTKFTGNTNDSVVEHISCYLTEAGDIANNENQRMKYFPSSLTKNAFTWFTTLPPHSIHDWKRLERLFHEQFYMGQSKISLKELCFTQVPEHELVKIAAGGLDYSIRKKLDIQYLRDMAQLADRVRQVERLKPEKARVSKGKKKRITYVDVEDQDIVSEVEYNHVEESEVDVAELKSGPSYVCKLLTPANGKNPTEPKENDKLPKKTYTFDMTKCDEIFDLLVSDGQIFVPPGAKVPPLDQRKKRGFCKYHNFLGYKTSQCFLFMDLVHNALNEGRQKFPKGKAPMKINSYPFQVVDVSYVEPAVVNMVEIIEYFNIDEFEESGNQIKAVFPKVGESL
ncbi:uncharacterized protein LOC127082522 [Lathyrus oleraceus]|uniref:uncharacterized protein LOC127082522 n=1 Tax=Pisum sativum TaxID=3888 RepID=UPI0021CE91B7|nr:uncharacterized protein LOC127082522 [Pisum sativum]